MELSNDNARLMVNRLMANNNLSTYKEFAQKYGMNANYISRMLNGHVRVSKKFWLHLTATYKMEFPSESAPIQDMIPRTEDEYKISFEATIKGMTIQSHSVKVSRV